jgi:hypothetical protein
MMTSAILSGYLSAGTSDRSSWDSLSRIKAGQSVEVRKRAGGTVKGAFESFSGDAVKLRDGRQDVEVPRADVSRVELDSGRKALWIGAATGGGAGAAIGAGVGSRLGNQSGGDFSGLTGAIAGVFALLGALAGLLAASLHHTTVYQAK